MAIESAFPQERAFWSPGMTLRDYFAAKAMAASITTSGAPWMFPDKGCSEQVAKMAYQMADAMLEARK